MLAMIDLYTASTPNGRKASIALEGSDYFGFVALGLAASYIMLAATSVIPSVLAGGIGSGTFESLLVTRTPLPVLLLGLSAYPLVMACVNAAVIVLGAVALGVRIDVLMLPAVGVLVRQRSRGRQGLSVAARRLDRRG